jgi:hypothetical protein
MYEHGSAPSFRSCALRAAPSFSYANCTVICYKKKLHCHLGMSTGLLVSHVQLQSTMYEHCRLIYSNLVSLIILALTIPAHSQFSVKKLTYIMWGVNSCFNSSIAFF